MNPILSALAQSIADRLPSYEKAAFLAAFVAAIPATDRDLSRVPWQFLAAELRALPLQPTEVQAVIDPVIAGLDLMAAGQEWSHDAARKAYDAIHEAAVRWSYALQSASFASHAAAWHALSPSAPLSVHEAARAAPLAEGHVHAAILRQRDRLLRLIQETSSPTHPPHPSERLDGVSAWALTSAKHRADQLSN